MQNHSTSPVHAESLIPASTSLPEITVKAVLLAIILVVVLTASNAYLALKVGTTISASIPAAVISMGILRLFRTHNVLENNIVQTAASAGEALVAALAYTLPALLMMHFWLDFNYANTVAIAMIGGILGVLFSVPLRRILLADKTLRFPEGVAIGNILKISTTSGAGLKRLIQGGIVGGAIAFMQTGLRVVTEDISLWASKGSTVFGFSIGFSPALIAAGYIVGINVAIALLLGVIIGWLAGVPILTSFFHTPIHHGAAQAAFAIGKEHIRFIGVGTMLVGGGWLLLTLIKPVFQGLHQSITALRQSRLHSAKAIARTDRDVPINYVMWGVIVLTIPLFFLLSHFINAHTLGISENLQLGVSFMSLFFIILIGFFVAAICGYFAGLIGSSNSPLSGITLAVLILGSFLLFITLNSSINFSVNPQKALEAAGMTIVIASIIACAGSISIDTIQDLKAGQMVGATPGNNK